MDEDGSKWEFQAPQFVDFTKLEDDQGADSFFDVDMESGSRVSQMFGGGGGKISDEFKPAEPMETVEEAAEPSPAAPAAKPAARVPKPSNMVTSWAGKNVQKATLSGMGVKTSGNSRHSNEINKQPSKARSSAGQSKPTLAESPVKRAMRQETPTRRSLREAVSETINNVRNSPHLKPKRLGTNTDAPRFNSQADKNLTSGSAARLRTRSKSPGHALTMPGMPRTPDVMRRFKNKLAAGTNKGINEFKVKKGSLASKDHLPVKPSQPAIKAAALTRPAEFKFATASRSKESRRRSMSVPDAPDFSRMLRSYTKPQTSAAVVRELTKPAPFPRAESRKRRLSDDVSAVDRFKSMAEQVTKFQKGTPDRFHTKPRGRSGSPRRTRLRSQSPRQLTVAVTPQLTTKGRSRPNYVVSQAEREQMEHEEAQRHQFRAKQVGETLPKFHYGEVERRPCTVPEPFNLAGAASRPFAKPQMPEIPAANFKSNPLNRKILEKQTGVPERKVIPVIEPESPAFALKKRMATRLPAFETKEEPERIVKAKPVPHYGVPVAMSLTNKRSTVPQPFSFAERDVMSAAAKEERIRKLLEEEEAAHEFHAQPIAKGVEHPRVLEKKALQPTVPAPFKMNIEERLESRINKWQEDINKELEDQKKAANFKASEPKVLSQAPFVPKPAEKHLIEISNFNLHTDRRAEERREYEMEKKKKEVDLDSAKRQLEQRKEREQEEEVQKMRKQQVHKAQPIRGYKPVEIKPSEKPLTMPMSPRLTSRSNRANSTFNRTGASSKSQ